MKHRGGAEATGLGGGAKTLIIGQSSGKAKLDVLINKASKEAHDLFFTKFGYCEAGVEKNEIRIGVEPSYEGDELKILSINKKKEESFFITGRAFGPWGSGIRSTTREYQDYTKKGKFVKFVDKWHPILFTQ